MVAVLPLVTGWVGPLAPVFANAPGGAIAWSIAYLLAISSVFTFLAGQTPKALACLLGIVLLVVWNAQASRPVEPFTEIAGVRVQEAVATVISLNATATSESEARVSPTLEPPRVSVEPLAVGGNVVPWPERVVARVANFGAGSVFIVTAMLDTDARQQKIYLRNREDIPAGETRDIALYAWFEGACYKPIILVPRTGTGQSELVTWLKAGRIVHAYSALTASGDIEAREAGPTLCLIHPEPTTTS